MTQTEKIENKCFKERMKQREKMEKDFVRTWETEETIFFHAKAIERLINRQSFPGCRIFVSMEAKDVNKDVPIFKIETNPKQGIGHSIGTCASQMFREVKDYKEYEYPTKKSQNHD